MSNWNTSVKELLSNYKNALISIIPWLDKNKIPHKEEDSYDDWDNICSVLYETMVTKSISFSKEFGVSNKPFAKYDLQYKSYKDFNFILIGDSNSSEELTVFVSFVNDNNFDMINVCNILKSNMNTIARRKIKFDEVKFYINPDRPSEYLEIEL